MSRGIDIQRAAPLGLPPDLAVTVDTRGVLPSRVVPDNRLNLTGAGIQHTYVPTPDPLVLAAGVAGSALISAPNQYDFFAQQLIASVWPTANGPNYNAGVINNQFEWSCRMRNRSTGTWWIQDFVDGQTVFGTGRYPGRLAIPIVISRNTTWEIEVRNDALQQLEFHFEFSGLWRLVAE